jgi:16S rRNA (guanine527-N7)-methyltransferase
MLPEPVSREINDRMDVYRALLVKWQVKINLISPDTLGTAKIRHFDDSAQLVPLIPPAAKILYDLGSGAGFPGLVIALLRPDLDVTLIESDSKKCAFLQTVSRETQTPVRIVQERIESAAQKLPPPDLVTARALAPLSSLLDLSKPWILDNPALCALFPKGARYGQELEDAGKNWTFSCTQTPSITDPQARILLLSNIGSL